MAYLRNIFFFLLLAFVLNIQGQQILSPNFVNNPSFEEYYNCPILEGQLYYCKDWWGLSTEYFNTCDTTTPIYFSVPLNFAGFQYAHTGNAYSGMVIYTNVITGEVYRETIKTKLNNSLIANKRYCTNFYTSLSDYCFAQNTSMILDSIGILLTKDSVPDNTSPILTNGIKVQNDIFNIDTVSWFKIPNTFIANGGELYLTIGNFDNVISNPSGTIASTYVYVDDVSVCECSFKFNLGNDTTLCNGQTLQLKVSMPTATYTWQDGSTDSTYTVTQAGTYWVKAYFADYNITTTDTINIMYKNCEDTLVIPNIFTPNGDNYNDYFVIKNSSNWDINLQVFNRWGNEVYKAENYQNNWDGKSKGNPLSDGTYFYIIKAKGLYSGREKEYKGSLMIMR